MVEVVGVELDEDCVEVVLEGCVLAVFDELPVGDDVVHGFEDEEPVLVCVVEQLGEG